MKVTVTEKENEQKIKFPCLMRSLGGLIIIATEIKDNQIAGTVVIGNGCHDIGYCTNTWIAPSFEPFNGTITLQND